MKYAFIRGSSQNWRFCRFSGSFEPILRSFLGVNIRMLILTPKKERKIGQNNPDNRRLLSFASYLISVLFLMRFGIILIKPPFLITKSFY
jgi:hypothetical protein